MIHSPLFFGTLKNKQKNYARATSTMLASERLFIVGRGFFKNHKICLLVNYHLCQKKSTIIAFKKRALIISITATLLNDRKPMTVLLQLLFHKVGSNNPLLKGQLYTYQTS